MIIAQIGMREYIVADALRRAQATAMADHQPCFGPHDRHMIGNRLGVRRADTDVDQRNPAAILCAQMPRRHLVPPPCAVGDRRLWVLRVSINNDPACTRQMRVIAVALQLLDGPAGEFIDIAVVVGEEDIFLDVFGRGACVVAQPSEREIGAQPVEQRQRARRAFCPKNTSAENAVGNLVADMGKLGGRKPA